MLSKNQKGLTGSINPAWATVVAGRACWNIARFCQQNASFAPAFSPGSGIRRIGLVMIASPRKNFANLWQSA
jgi:hypothetical protein